MLNKACYRISIVLAIWCGQAKTIRIRHVWMRLFIFFFFGKRRKKSPFSNISGYMWPGPKLALKGLNRSIFKGEIFLENHWYTSFTEAFSLISTKI